MVSKRSLQREFEELKAQSQSQYQEYLHLADLYNDLVNKYNALGAENTKLKQDNQRIVSRLNPTFQEEEEARRNIAQSKEIISGLQKQMEECKVEMSELYSRKQQTEQNIQREINNILSYKQQVEQELHSRQMEVAELDAAIKEKKQVFCSLDDEIFLSDFGLYAPTYSFKDSTGYKERLQWVRDQQKLVVKDAKKAVGTTTWTVNGSRKEGQKMVRDVIQLTYRAFNNDCDDIIRKINFSNIDAAHNKIDRSYEILNKLIAMFGISIPDNYRAMKHDEATLAYDYAVVKEEEKEELRALREQEREERKAQKEIEEKRKALEKEKKKIEQEQERLRAILRDKKDDAAAQEKLDALDAEMVEIEKGIKDTDYREANKRAGYVYIISNIGSFGENVYKIGMTRRLNPEERINELGGASVPFKFDTHALIFTDDAPGLEATLHNYFDDRKVNLVNPRKEFYRCTLSEIEAAVKAHFDKTVDFIPMASAEEWRKSEMLRRERNSSSNPAMSSTASSMKSQWMPS